MNIHLNDAKLCANCDTVHNAETCPVCCSSNFLSLCKILNRSSNNEKARKNLEANRHYHLVVDHRFNIQ